MGDSNDQRVVVLALNRDGQLTCEILARAGIDSHVCSDEYQLGVELNRGAGALVCAEEALTDEVRCVLDATLDSQPTWSDLPVLVVAAPGVHGGRLAHFALQRGVCVLSRPMAIDTIVTAVQCALRARRRQYEVRDLLNEREEASRRKDYFLAMLAHELRNPLAPVRYGVHVLQTEYGQGDGRASRAISIIDRQVAHMARVIDDLLDISRITRGKIELKRELIDLSHMVRQVVDARQELANSKGVELTFEARDLHYWVNGDSIRLTQVVDNLIDNAEKFSYPGGHVKVIMEEKDGDAVVRVVDNGEGIDPCVLAHLFETFSQADRSLDRKRGGLGLGLSIVNEIVQLHGGKAFAYSGGIGSGSTFTVRIPSAKTAPSKLSSIARPSHLHNERTHLPNGDMQTFKSSPAKRSLKVLIVEDNRDSAELIRIMLTLYGHNVEVAHSGLEGIDCANRFRPDVMLCDIGLPGMSGYEVARALGLEPNLRPQWLVAVTGYGGPDHRRDALSAGFDAYLVKPVNPDDLLSALTPSRTPLATSPRV